LAIEVQGWSGASGELADHVLQETERTLQAYGTQPTLVREHVGIEANIFSGGYGRRQVFELIQNAADAVLVSGESGRVAVVLTETALYCANEGAPIDTDGVTAILSAYLSQKRGAQIGHFGLGFKSVLNVTSTPQFFCRAGSFGFDLERSHQRIREVLPGVSQVPVLRLAHVIDPSAEASLDPELAALMEWATTVVRLPRNRGESSWLSEEIAQFPANFLIFSPHVSDVELIDRVAGVSRSIQVRSEDGIVSIIEGGEGSVWAVFKRDLSTADLSEAEFDDADRTTRQRETLPLIWAMPEAAGRLRGRFWAFFPTETETTLSGILNAPWKTNADRQNLLDGPFNRRLLAEFVGIIRDAWNDLSDQDDPGGLLDLLPARERDEKNWADSTISQGLYRELASTPSIPNGTGTLVLPSQVLLRPDEGMTDGGRQWITANPGAEGEFLTRWVHASVETRERRPRAERLGCKKGQLGQWLTDISAPKTPAACRRSLSLVEAFWPSSSTSLTIGEIRNAAFVLTSTRELVRPDATKLCLPVKHAEPPEGVLLVHKAVVSDSVATSALKRLGLKEVGVEVQLEQEIKKESPHWDRFWKLIRALPQDAASKFVRGHASRLRAKTCAETFVPIREALLPGNLIQTIDNDLDKALVVDIQFHQPDLALLKAAGAVDGPRSGFTFDEVTAESCYPKYLSAARADYRRHESRGYESGIVVGSSSSTAGPLHVLTRGSVDLRTRFAIALSEILPTTSHWSIHYGTRPLKYATTHFLEPARWCLANFGVFPTSLGPTPVTECVGPAFTNWRHFLPVASVSDQLAGDLGLPQTLDMFGEVHWRRAFAASEAVVRLESLEDVWAFYAEAAKRLSAPKRIVAFSEGQSLVSTPSVVHVCDDRERFNALQEVGTPSVLVNTRLGVETLVSNWGCVEGVASVGFESTADPEPLLDVIPGLEQHVSPAIAEATLMQPCARIWLEVKEAGSVRQHEVSFAHSGAVLCYRADVDAEALFRRVLQHLGLDLSDEERTRALAYLGREQRRRLICNVRTATTVPEKLLVALGEEAISRQLPTKVVDSALQASATTPVKEVLARAAVAVFGVELLKTYAAEFVDAGFDPPRQWNGGKAAVAFCEELGFPPEYAGFATGRRDPMLQVDGPVELKPLHDFQEVIAERVRQFFLQTTPDRGLLSLPTGAGKTRVVVEALIQAMKPGRQPRVIVWIAQTDELCEQAVQAWSQAWRSIGPSARLRISRLWGATNDMVRPFDGGHVVVCTYHSLASRLNSAPYKWLLDAHAVVIDEAHGSTAHSYTEILHAFGLTAQKSERHLIGLTATPFRGSGFDEEETRWLANRYGQKRFDQGTMQDEDPYAHLQARGILAKVDHEVLEGREIQLSGEELEHLAQYKVLPSSAEQRLGDDDGRNGALVESITAMDDSWPILLFATSVSHAQLLAALLSLNGVIAKAISGSTDPGARRHYISEFKAGRIRVLTNYGVLTTGFDAPAVRALVIARPVYSRGLYQQMVGRGLRGPRNGGKDRCLIVNVADNVAQYGDRLAFRDFEHLWQPWRQEQHRW
jgi:superfamily II DNA or RNA helicase